MPFMGTSIKPSIFKAGKTDKLYTRHCKIRDRSVLSNVYLNHKWLDLNVIYILFTGCKSHKETIALVWCVENDPFGVPGGPITAYDGLQKQIVISVCCAAFLTLVKV